MTTVIMVMTLAGLVALGALGPWYLPEGRALVRDVVVGSAITAVDIATDVVTIAGDVRADIARGDIVIIRDSTGNDGMWTVVRVALNGFDTDVKMDEDVTNATADGEMIYGYVMASSDITAVNIAADVVTIEGDVTADIKAADTITIHGSTGNDGTWTVALVALVGGNTNVEMVEDVTDATVDGVMFYGEVEGVRSFITDADECCCEDYLECPEDAWCLANTPDTLTVTVATGDCGAVDCGDTYTMDRRVPPSSVCYWSGNNDTCSSQVHCVYLGGGKYAWALTVQYTLWPGPTFFGCDYVKVRTASDPGPVGTYLHKGYSGGFECDDCDASAVVSGVA